MTAARPRLRASRAYELVPFERLPAAARRAHAALLGDADFYGLLRPRSRGRTAKAVDRESALLLHTLREPGPLPAYLGRGRQALEALAALRGLVLDGIVEVAGPGGPFASGAAGLALLDAAVGPAAAPAGRTAELSAEALRLGAALAGEGAAAVARRLYAFNREPLTPARARRVPNAAAARRALGLAPGGALARRVARHWRETDGSEAWASWAPRAAAGASPARGAKLYVSPATDDLPAALDALVAALAGAGPVPFKVARQPDGLLRPDKLVAYFPSLDLLRRAAARLEPAVRGLRAQGVPFTAAVTADGLLSWGADPPEGALGSWRGWLCGRLAQHLVDAAGSGARDAAGEAARRVAADGVDPATWAPAAFARAVGAASGLA